MRHPLVILSGGQTGVDRAALEAALELGVPCGGACSAGRKAEDGRIPDRYPLTELGSPSYAVRTRQNVEDADGTLIIHFGPLTGGTALTLRTCRKANKPVRLIDGRQTPVEEGARAAQAFIIEHGLQRLNVAGPRASHCTEAYPYTRELMTVLLGALRDERKS